MNLNKALHLFSRSKHYYITTIGSLGLLLTMLFSVFSLMSLIYWQPLPYERSDELLWLEGTVEYQGEQVPMANHRNLNFVRSNSNTVSDLAAYFSWSQYKLTNLAERPSVPVIMASHQLFNVLGTKPFLGRFFSAFEASGNRQPSVILSYHVWEKYFDADKNIIDKKIMLNQRSFSIIGITKPDLVLPQSDDVDKSIWIPFDMDEQLNPKTFGGYTGALKAVIRLNEHQSITAAEEELGSLMNQAGHINMPQTAKKTPASAKVTPFIEAVRGDSGNLVLMLLGGALLLTAIGVINLCSLQLARAVGQTQKRAIAAAFGASQKQLFLEILKHNAITISIACVIGLMLTFTAFGVISQLAEGAIPRLNELSLSIPLVLLAFITCIILVLIFCWVELRSIKYDQLQHSLQSSGKGTSKQVKTGVSHTLIGLQLGFSLITLVSCSQVVYQTLNEALRPSGIDTESLATLHVNLSGIPTKEERENLYRSLESELTATPEILSISYSSEARLPKALNYNGVKDIKGQNIASARVISQDLKQLALYGLTVEGAVFNESDITSKAPVVLINERLALRLPKPVTSQKISFTGSDKLYSVQGVVKNTNYPGLSLLEVPEVYLPRAYRGQRTAVLTVKLKSNDSKLDLNKLYNLVTKVHPNLNITHYSTVESDFKEINRKFRFAAIIALSLAICSMIMVAAGIFGIVSYLIRMRQYDLGVHLAFGSTLKGLFNSQFLLIFQPIIASVVLAASMIFFVAGFSRTQPDFILNLNWYLFFGVIACLITVASFACVLPLKQVIQSNPIKALRNE